MLVIGGGPSGASTAYWLAESGADVLFVERKHFPREKTCGDGLTPRSVRQLYDMGLFDQLVTHHRYDGLRAKAFGKELLLPWPEHPVYPSHGYVVTRSDLDDLVASRAEKSGATLWQGAEAIAPLGTETESGGPALGAVINDRDHGTTSNVHAEVCGRRRWSELPLRPGARSKPRPFGAPRHGDPRLLRLPPPR